MKKLYISIAAINATGIESNNPVVYIKESFPLNICQTKLMNRYVEVKFDISPETLKKVKEKIKQENKEPRLKRITEIVVELMGADINKIRSWLDLHIDQHGRLCVKITLDCPG